ncbi:MAG TPA: hypothetical protein PKM63_09545 [Panacibacter sp.]|nr:hypothetical protein [Panacibacter sp.]HNP44516.1 hypothetical protein [Panacibacter sp.]
MKTVNAILLMIVFIVPATLPAYSRQNPDSLLLAHSEQWTAKPNKGLFGLSKPQFGPYTTTAVIKLDSPVIKQKTKDSSFIGFESSTDGTDFDQSKYLTIKKSKFYKLSLSKENANADAVFAIASESQEKRQTLFGKLLSKNDEGKDEVLNYKRDIPGIIQTENDSVHWKFMLQDFTSGGQPTAYMPYPVASISGGYLKNNEDSLAMQLYSSFAADLVLINNKGEHVAALAFKQKKPDMWIRNDISESYQQAIATMFAVIISIKDY